MSSLGQMQKETCLDKKKHKISVISDIDSWVRFVKEDTLGLDCTRNPACDFVWVCRQKYDIYDMHSWTGFPAHQHLDSGICHCLLCQGGFRLTKSPLVDLVKHSEAIFLELCFQIKRIKKIQKATI